ncbi:hypothetical protein KIW84_073063 [Lathyrus oleraceus]|uniref:Uncharacterized protein n=1 Tax=Pisum sativum TaxID=3888 RepID=A0A9D4VQA2_PEA|nr:hypothetical protein KIW84_073063 [Pisum sativum]
MPAETNRFFEFGRFASTKEDSKKSNFRLISHEGPGYARIFLVSILSELSKFYHSTSKSCYQVASKLHSLNQTHTPGVPKQQITSLIQIMFIVMDTSNLAAFDNGRVLPNFIGKKVRTGVQVNQSDGAVITRKPSDDSQITVKGLST